MTHFDSTDFWERRYKNGGNSGAGSYGRIARQKSDFLTSFITNHAIRTMVEYGCGDGNNLRLTEERNPELRIIGVDVSRTALRWCKEKMPRQTFLHKDEFNDGFPQKNEPVDLVVSLEVIFHLIEDEVFQAYMDSLTGIGSEWLIILSPDEDENVIDAHVKKRKYTNSRHLRERYEMVEEVDFRSAKCFSDWKIFRKKNKGV